MTPPTDPDTAFSSVLSMGRWVGLWLLLAAGGALVARTALADSRVDLASRIAYALIILLVPLVGGVVVSWQHHRLEGDRSHDLDRLQRRFHQGRWKGRRQ